MLNTIDRDEVEDIEIEVIESSLVLIKLIKDYLKEILKNICDNKKFDNVKEFLSICEKIVYEITNFGCALYPPLDQPTV